MLRADPRDRLEIRRLGLAVRLRSSSAETRTCAGVERHAVEPAGVVEHGIEAAVATSCADPLDDLPRRQRLAERRDRVRAVPSGLTTLPLGPSSLRSSAIARWASSLEQSIRRKLRINDSLSRSEGHLIEPHSVPHDSNDVPA